MKIKLTLVDKIKLKAEEAREKALVEAWMAGDEYDRKLRETQENVMWLFHGPNAGA